MTIVQEWKTVPIRETYLEFHDGPHATPPPAESGAIYLGIKNLTEYGQLDFSEIRYIAEADLPNWTKRVVPQKGDIVFTYEATLNLYAMIPEGFHGCLGRRLALIRPNPDIVDPRFLFFYFFGYEWRSIIKQKVIAGATVDRIPLIEFPNFEITLPPLETQRKIAAVLSAYDDLIENNMRRIKLLEQAAHDLYREWFVEFRFPGHEDVPLVDSGTEYGMIPQGWEVRTVGSICDQVDGTIKTGPFGSQLHQSDYTDFGTPVVMPKNIVNNRISEDGIARIDDETLERLSQHQLSVGEIIYGRRGDIGRQALITDREQSWLCGTGCIRIALGDDVVLPLYLHLFLCQENVITWIYNQAIGATMPNLNSRIIRSISLIVPPYDLQSKFVSLVNSSYELINSNFSRNQILRESRDLLLPRLVSGQVDVSELEIEGN